MLTIIYSDQIENLLPFQAKASHWLPETWQDPPKIYHHSDFVCTTRMTILNLVKALIQTNDIQYSNVIFIIVNSNRSIAYTFGPDGDVNNFFSL